MGKGTEAGERGTTSWEGEDSMWAVAESRVGRGSAQSATGWSLSGPPPACGVRNSETFSGPVSSYRVNCG